VRFKYVFLVVALAAVVIVLAAISRLNGFSARAEPSTVERVVARTARRWAVPGGARTAVNPVTFSPEVWTEARSHFADHCATCHANDGGGGTVMGPNFYPKVPDMRLADTQELTDGDLYWIIKNGIRLTGMPAWGEPGGDDLDTWKLVHFIRRLNDLTAEDLKAMEALNPRSREELEEERDDDAFLAGENPAPSSTDHRHGKENQ
jgi:mono/diheme cytochrome c family protein